MGLFGRKEKDKDRRINQDHSSVNIPVYGPHDTLCPQDYKLSSLISSFEANFEERCKTWLQQANPDMYNRGYMDLLIDQLQAEAISVLDIQEVDHQGAIYELGKIWTGDKVKADKKLEDTLQEEADVARELSHLEKIYHNKTSFEAFDIDLEEDEKNE